MEDKTNNILVDYEGLCGELNDILEVLELASTEDGPKTFPILHTANHALKKLITEHCDIASEYRKELSHE